MTTIQICPVKFLAIQMIPPTCQTFLTTIQHLIGMDFMFLKLTVQVFPIVLDFRGCNIKSHQLNVKLGS